MEKKKRNLILGLVLVLLLLVVGVTYAFFTYESGTKSDIVTGQIYMNYEETSTISLTGVFPETKEQALARNDENGVFEFTITGRNTSKYPVYYEIDLLEGGVITGKTEQSTKILTEHVRIYLERDGEPLVDGMTYKDWNNRRIYVDTVPANQTSNIEHKYTLRMWIDENVTISDTDPNADYTTSEWNDAYTSLKVRVVGDFEYKDMSTDASCFAYNVIDDPNVITYDYPIITLDTSEEKVEACMANTVDGFDEDLSTAQDGYQSFCEGTGTIDDSGFGIVTMREYIALSIANFGVSKEQIISTIPVVTDITIETRYYELNTSEESVNACKEYMLDRDGGDYSDAKDNYQSFCEGTGTVEGGYSIYDDQGWLYLGLIERNVLTQVEEIPQVIEITDYDESCGLDVVIPSIIEGLPVTRIADGVYNNRGTVIGGVFSNRGLTSIKLPNTINYVGDGAFMDNNLTNIQVPDSVTYIGEQAFYGNSITDIEVGTNIMKIERDAFSWNPIINVNIKGKTLLGPGSFSGSNYSDDIRNYQTFQYGGTCAELNQNEDIFGGDNLPQTIITTDTNSCQYTNITAPPM